MRRHKGKILRGNQNTARNESTNFSSLAQSEQLWRDNDLAWEQEYQQQLQVHYHFGVLGQQNPQQQKMSDLQNPLPLPCASSFIFPASPLMGTRQKDIQVNPEASSSQSTATVVLQKESKVKQITGPMNFGIELLYSKTHNNIELHTQQGAVVQANSAILALNSPVIHHMTTTLELTIIDMEEFSEQSVQCFVEAAYTGSLPSITKGILRDLNKIVHAFKVDWLQNSCFAIFRDFSFTDTKPGNQLSYADLCFLFDEAAFVLSKLKQENFMDEALNKIKGTGTKQEFVTRYLIDNDLEKVPCHQLDMVIKLVGDDVELIVQHVREKLLVRLGLEGAVISPNFKYLLQNCDLSHCLKRNPQLIEQLFDILQEVATNEDLKWVLRLHRKLASL